MACLLLLAWFLQIPAPPAIPSAVVNVPRLIAESIDGRAATARLQAFQAEKRKAITDGQASLERLNASRALPAQIERARVELQRLTEDSQVDVAALDRQIQLEFEKKLRPVLDKIADENQIGIIFAYPQQMIDWVSPAVDITAKVIEQLDAAAKENKNK